MAKCTITVVPPPPPPPAEKKIVLELNELEAQVLFAVLAKVYTNSRLGNISYNIFSALSKLPGTPVQRPSIYNGNLRFED